ncbi:hypothetical protein PIIN_09598 [Serendipita indica DSM 11827]|uniref:F-box domain-containing protein n=1 Tax=Serendipita indica (strain DSM 11827) TaxID=1109443 RepID=G4TWB4_SERID|nr:hypothetical protein PIIN_09598 [Serendipita indica DSM 11827]
MCISSRWMNLIISTPVLWTDIVLDLHSAEDALATLRVHITLSRFSPISIIIFKHTTEDQALLRVALDQLKSHGDRIQSLYVNSEFILSTFYEVLGPLRNLTVLRCRAVHSWEPIHEPTVNFINCHSGLKEIQNVMLTPTILKSRWSCRLATVTTSADVRVHDLIAVPSKFPALRTIFFHPKSQRSYPPGRGESSSLSSCTRLQTWNLKMVEDSLQPQQDMDMLLSAVSDSLETLRTRLDIEVLPLFLPLLAQLCCLQRVTLDIVPTQGSFHPPVLMSPSSAHDLVVRISTGSQQWNGGWSETVVDMFKSSFPHVKQLTLEASLLKIQALPSVCHL